MQAAAIDFVVAQEGNFYIKGEVGMRKMGTCYQIAAVVDGLLCGLFGKIVARLGENCKRLWAMSSTGRALGVAWRDITRVCHFDF